MSAEDDCRTLRPGDWAVRDDELGYPLFRSPEEVGRMSARPVGFVAPMCPVLVLAVVPSQGGHERALVLYGPGLTAWCWGGYLTPMGGTRG